MGQQLGAQGAFQPVIHRFISHHGKVHLAVRAHFHGRDGSQRCTVDLGDHLFHRGTPVIVDGTAQRPAGGGHHGEPQVAVLVKIEAGQLTLHRENGRIVAAVGAHKVARALFQRRTVVGRRVHKAVLFADAVHALVLAQVPAVLAVGGKRGLRRAGVLPGPGRFVALRRRVDGPEYQRIHQCQQDAHPKHGAGRAEPLEQRVPLGGGLGGIFGPAAGGLSTGAVGAAHPAVHKERHLRADGQRRNGKDEQKFNKSDSHRAFSFIFQKLRAVRCPLSFQYSIPCPAVQAPGFSSRKMPCAPRLLCGILRAGDCFLQSIHANFTAFSHSCSIIKP